MARGDVMTSKGQILNMDSLIDQSKAPIDNKTKIEAPMYDPAAKGTNHEMRGFVPSTDDVKPIVTETKSSKTTMADITKVKVTPSKKKAKTVKVAEPTAESNDEIGDLINELDKSSK